jgi:cysteine desulfurase
MTTLCMQVEVDVRILGVDLLTVVGHKFGAPKGVAALYMRRGTDCNTALSPFLFGGGQEGGRRAGTENVLLIVGLGEAARLALSERSALIAHMLGLKRQLVDGLEALRAVGHKVHFNGPVVAGLRSDKSVLLQLPNTVSVSFSEYKAYELMPLIADSVACSAGSACHAGAAAGGSISPVLAAMSVPNAQALGTLRVSLGRHTTTADVDKTVAAIKRGLDALNKAR